MAEKAGKRLTNRQARRNQAEESIQVLERRREELEKHTNYCLPHYKMASINSQGVMNFLRVIAAILVVVLIICLVLEEPATAWFKEFLLIPLMIVVVTYGIMYTFRLSNVEYITGTTEDLKRLMERQIAVTLSLTEFKRQRQELSEVLEKFYDARMMIVKDYHGSLLIHEKVDNFWAELILPDYHIERRLEIEPEGKNYDAMMGLLSSLPAWKDMRQVQEGEEE